MPHAPIVAPRWFRSRVVSSRPLWALHHGAGGLHTLGRRSPPALDSITACPNFPNPVLFDRGLSGFASEHASIADASVGAWLVLRAAYARSRVSSCMRRVLANARAFSVCRLVGNWAMTTFPHSSKAGLEVPRLWAHEGSEERMHSSACGTTCDTLHRDQALSHSMQRRRHL